MGIEKKSMTCGTNIIRASLIEFISKTFFPWFRYSLLGSSIQLDLMPKAADMITSVEYLLTKLTNKYTATQRRKSVMSERLDPCIAMYFGALKPNMTSELRHQIRIFFTGLNNVTLRNVWQFFEGKKNPDSMAQF